MDFKKCMRPESACKSAAMRRTRDAWFFALQCALLAALLPRAALENHGQCEMNDGVGGPGTKGCGSRPGGDAYWPFPLLNTSTGALRRKSADRGRPPNGTLPLNMFRREVRSKLSKRQIHRFLTLLGKGIVLFFKNDFFSSLSQPTAITPNATVH